MPISFSPATGYAYVSSNMVHDNLDLPGSMRRANVRPCRLRNAPAHPDYIGEFQAIDVATGKKMWSKNTKLLCGRRTFHGRVSGFTGTLTDRDFTAFNAKTGDVSLKFRTNQESWAFHHLHS